MFSEQRDSALALLAQGNWLVAVKVCEEKAQMPDTGWVRNTLGNRSGRKAFLTEKNSVPFACVVSANQVRE